MFTLFAKRKHQPEKSPTERLLKVLEMTQEDLDANRAGQLSPMQRKRMNKGFYSGAAFAGVYVVCSTIGLLQLIFNNVPSQDRLSNAATWVLVLLVVISVGFAAYKIHQHRQTLTTAQMIAFTGQVRRFANGHTQYLVVITHTDQPEPMYALIPAYAALIEGETYTFYSPSFNPAQIMTAEHIPTDAMRK